MQENGFGFVQAVEDLVLVAVHEYRTNCIRTSPSSGSVTYASISYLFSFGQQFHSLGTA